jgi:sterol desaturase/sphingolipid hydroxylase (fatty acid hydroxylase superfamily)
MQATYDPTSYALGQKLKFWNAVTAVGCGMPAAIILALWMPRPKVIAAGLAIGLLWANFFEYAYHRWILHWPETAAFERHGLHHSSVGRPNEPEHLPLGGSPKLVAMLFLVNGGIVVVADALLRIGLAAGVLVGFVVYMILSEDIHWRFHMGGWIPGFLRGARAHHLLHHDRPHGNYAVFFPLFDRIFGTYS